MKRTKAIRLVLLGGGVAAMLAGCGDNDSRRRACEEARAQLRADAEEICRRSTASSSSRGFMGAGWMGGRTRTDTGSRAAATTSSSSRGGFGATGSRSSS